MKHKGLITVLQGIGIKLHKSRLEYLAMLMLGIVETRTVNLKTVVTSMQSQAQLNSAYRRAQRFFAAIEVDNLAFTKIMFSLIPQKSYILCIDRTNWKFGKFNINILMVGVVSDGLAIPLAFRLLKKRGNSNTLERTEIMEQVIKLIPVEEIEVLLGDREFIGQDWFQYLDLRNIPFSIRIRKSSLADEWFRLEIFFKNLKVGERRSLHHRYKIHNCQLSVIATKSIDNQLVIIVSNRSPRWALAMYKLRWQIESLFKALKTSGFNIEDTHLRHISRLSTLVAVVSFAFIWALKTGSWLHKQKPIKLKSHGRREVSVFRLGLDYILRAIAMFSLDNKLLDNAFKVLSCT